MKWPKNGPNNGQNLFFQKRHPYYFLKYYLQTKFQLIWPLNSRENGKISLKKWPKMTQNGQKWP